MKINLGKDWVDFVVEGEDDLYVIYLLIDPGDVIYGWTVREFRGREGSRGERIRIYVGLRVEELEYHAFRGTLRVRGVLIEVPEWFEGARGSHHTMELTYGLEYRLVKPSGIDREFISKVLEMFSGSSISVLLVSVSMEEVAVAHIRRFGRELLGTISIQGGGKEGEDSLDRFRRTLRNALTQVKQWVQSRRPTHIVVVGNHMTLSIARDVINEELGRLGLPIIYHEQGEGGLAGVYEFERVGVDVLRKLNISLGQEYVNEVFNRLGAGNGLVAVGFDEVRKALEFGAVETMIVLDETYKERGGEMRDLISMVLKTRANLVIIPLSTEGGEKLRSIGGIAALLRFPISSQP
ncbi:single-stranded DNA-binding protein [Vulcanisaeta sp. JCM 16161]|uniref:single-stranded DNA-binding protein n=1 Tax=Vulcanisaeta sp. JCM 16161 TaxID=1295372 RepID=UPI00406C4866